MRAVLAERKAQYLAFVELSDGIRRAQRRTPRITITSLLISQVVVVRTGGIA
jgi:hypothetical protein